MSKQQTKQPKEFNQLEFFKGKEETFMVPSGDTYTIREQNADDDEVLSRFSSRNPKADELNNMNAFVQTIVVGKNGKKGGITLKDVLSMRLNDKHHIVLKSRMLSIGKELKFTTNCPNEDCELHKIKKELTFNEDLTQYDNEFTEDSDTDFPYQAKRYESNDSHLELTLSSGVRMRMKYMDGYSELKVLDAAEGDTISLNTAVYSRDPEVFVNGEWQTVQRLNFASKRDNIQIQNTIRKDLQSMQVVDCQCPKCKIQWFIQFTKIKDFFFPSEI